MLYILDCGQSGGQVCGLKYEHQITSLQRNYTHQDVLELLFILAAMYLCSRCGAKGIVY